MSNGEEIEVLEPFKMFIKQPWSIGLVLDHSLG